MKKIVCIGGGTGLSNLLRGLREILNIVITAIVSMMDSGGSSGRLRDERGALPPGDFVRCVAALMTTQTHMADVWKIIFRHRFQNLSGGNGLDDHTVANLLFTALQEMYGDVGIAARMMCELFQIRGTVLPVTTASAQLCAELDDGLIVRGETHIDRPRHNTDRRVVKLWLEPAVSVTPQVIEAIGQADLVVIGPGDLKTSIDPPLLVTGMASALQATPAKISYIPNIMTKAGETGGPSYAFKASDFLAEVEKVVGRRMDYVLVNTRRPSGRALAAYAKENAVFVEPDLDDPRVIKAPLIYPDNDLARHDRTILASIIAGLL